MKPKFWGLIVAGIHLALNLFILVLAFNATMRRLHNGATRTAYDRALADAVKVMNFPFGVPNGLLLSCVMWGLIAYIIASLVQKRRGIPITAPRENTPPIADPNGLG